MMKYILISIGLICPYLVAAQSADSSEKAERELIETTQELVAQGNAYVFDDAFAEAEAAYRKAIGINPKNLSAKYNAGTNYYENKKYEESTASLLKATAVAVTKAEKHRAYHNLGNALYQQENFEGAVEAYKNALRNNPRDEETRYNLALAKKEQEENGGGGGGDKDKEQNEDEQEENQDQKDQDGDGDQQEGDDGEEKESDDQGEEKDKNKEGKEQPDQDGTPKDQDKEQPGDKGDQQEQAPQQPRPGQLSPQQVKSLLEAMRNEERKTQEKVNAQKIKGAKVKTEKDW